MQSEKLKVEDLPHYTYDDYTKWDGQWEIIMGIPYAMTPAPTKKHQLISLKIAAQLDSLLQNCSSFCTTYQAIDWKITDDTVVQPDVLVVCGDNPDEKILEVPPVLIFEILSPSTGKKDRTLKYRLYQNAGVKYYCIVDPVSLSVDVFLLNGGLYDKKDDLEDGKIVFEIGKCSIPLDFQEIFKQLTSIL